MFSPPFLLFSPPLESKFFSLMQVAYTVCVEDSYRKLDRKFQTEEHDA